MIRKISISQILLLLSLLIYSGITLWVGLFHFEQWRDQAHVWVSVRDGSWWDLFVTVPAHTHPFLWFFLVKLLVLMGLTYQSAQVLNILCCISACALLFLRSPLPWWFKIAFPFSFPLLYEFAMPGRIYALGILLSFLICSEFQQRHRRPLPFCTILALNFHTHFLFLSLCAPVLILFVYESWVNKTLFSKNYIISLIVVIVSGFYLLWYITQVGQNAGMINLGNTKNNILEIFNLALTVEKTKYVLLILITIMGFILIQSRQFKSFFITLFALVFMFYTYHNLVPNFIRYYQILTVILICLMWLSILISKEKKSNSTNLIQAEKVKGKKAAPKVRLSFWPHIYTATYILFTSCILISCKAGIANLKNEISTTHSDSKNAATFILKNKLLEYILVGHRSYTVSSIVPYLPKDKQIWYADQQEFGTYLKFDSLFYKTHLSVSYTQAIQNSQKKFNHEKKLALILSLPIPKEFEANFNLIYATKSSPIQRDESYFIYVRQ